MVDIASRTPLDACQIMIDFRARRDATKDFDIAEIFRSITSFQCLAAFSI